MRTLLQINSSLNGAAGQSTQLADRFVAAWRAAHPGGRVIVRDLARDPLPHLDGARFAAFLAKPHERTPEQQRVVDESDALVAELRAADEVVLAAPMYNFGIPSTLKAYFDHIARAGVTFRYTANGSEGLLGGRKVTVVVARGGRYLDTPADTQTPYVRNFLAFLGLRDVAFVHAEGLAIDEATRSASLAQARAAIDRMFEPEALAA